MRLLRHLSPIGLHIGGRFVGAVQLARRNGRCEIANAAFTPRQHPGEPIDAEEVHRISTILTRRGFTGHSIALAAPDDMLIGAVLDLPPRTSGAPIDRIAAAELGRVHKTDASSLTVGLWELPAPARRRDGLPTYAVACPARQATSLAELFEAEGLDLVALDARACALVRACAPLVAPAPRVSSIVDLSFDAARVAIAVGPTVAYERVISASSIARLIEQIAASLDVEVDLAQYIAFELGLTPRFDDERDSWELLADARKPLRSWFDALARELTLATAYVLERYGQEAPASVLLTGIGAAIPAIDTELARRLSAPCRTVRAADLAACPDHKADVAAHTALTTAIGLAMRFDR
ncbi:MAG: hypothetical protein KF866_10000 [Phycisphaeraceae bacterium]|nr:hypothetical protein [Phycisphaeraceae bacterium]MCW5754832.1 hypothetical protein [Phycisphaeraceae bacterium]